MEDFRLPVGVVASLKTVRFTGSPIWPVRQGKMTYALMVTWENSPPPKKEAVKGKTSASKTSPRYRDQSKISKDASKKQVSTPSPLQKKIPTPIVQTMPVPTPATVQLILSPILIYPTPTGPQLKTSQLLPEKTSCDPIQITDEDPKPAPDLEPEPNWELEPKINKTTKC